MCRVLLHASLVTFVLSASLCLQAQVAPPVAVAVAVPRVVRLTGTFVPANGVPPSPVETVTLAVYSDEIGGEPLWQETQYVTVGLGGQYAVLLGSTQPDGLPVDLFASGEARWLGRRFERLGEPEQPRVLLASVPYALKAANADTLGGLPPSAYQLAPTTAGGASASPSVGLNVAQAAAAPTPQAMTSGTAGCIAEFMDTTDLGCSPMVDVGGAIGLGTPNPLDRFHVRFTNTNGRFTGYAVQNLGSATSSYSGMLFYDQYGSLGLFQGFNNATHEYRINNISAAYGGSPFNGSINFMIGSSSKFQVDTSGVLVSGAMSASDAISAPRFAPTASGGNTIVGDRLQYNAFDPGNCSLTDCPQSGFSNTAVGKEALFSNSGGYANTAIGSGYNGSGLVIVDGRAYDDPPAPLFNNNTGHGNTAIGFAALFSNTTGNDNVAVGHRAGDMGDTLGYLSGITTGSNNIYLGANVRGTSYAESNAMYLGKQGTQTKTVIAGIRGATTGAADAVPVMIDSFGQLGTVSSSRRFKEDIQDMGDVSRALFALRPVTFRYSQAYANGTKPIQYGLVAEEVAEAFPDLAVRNTDGGVDTVHYETLNVLLLNELQKQRVDIQKQQQRIEDLEKRLEALTAAAQK